MAIQQKDPRFHYNWTARNHAENKPFQKHNCTVEDKKQKMNETYIQQFWPNKNG